MFRLSTPCALLRSLAHSKLLAAVAAAVLAAGCETRPATTARPSPSVGLPSQPSAVLGRLDDGVPHIDEFAGNVDNLPVGCRVTPDQLVAWARRMPAVQRAIEEFARRGYVPVAAADTALSGCRFGVPGSSVMLAYLKPGAFIDSFHVAAPMILVATRLNPATGEPATAVSGGMLVGDGEARVVFSGDSLAIFQGADYSFTVFERGGGGGDPRRIAPESGDALRDPSSSFNRYLRCAGWTTIGCVAGLMRFGGPAIAPIKLAVLVGSPEVGLAILAGCTMAAGFTCFGSV